MYYQLHLPNQFSTIIVKSENLINKIEYFPLELVALMISEALRQGNDYNTALNAFQKKPESDKSRGGFDWCESFLGEQVYQECIEEQNFIYCYEHTKQLGKYVIESYDHFQWYKDDMPNELVQLICRTIDFYSDLQVTNWESHPDLKGLFKWKDTQQGYNFWHNIYINDYFLFNNKTSLTDKIKSNGNDNALKLQKQNSFILSGNIPEGNILCGKKNKSSITIESLSFRECLGR